MSDTQEDKWPGVRAAYDFVIPSYSLMVSRFEAADNRLTALLTFGASITLAAPLLGKAAQPMIAFSSPWLLLAVTMFVVSVGIGLYGRVSGAITLPNPAVLFRESLDETDWAFRKNMIYFAGEHFDANARAIRHKGNLAFAVALLLVCEIILFLFWMGLASR
jgi:hypothetical protein